MKKYISIVLMAAMIMCCLSACGQKESDLQTEGSEDLIGQAVDESETESNKTSDNQIKVVTTIFPEYDWVREIAGGEISHIDVTMLLDDGVDLHSYQPTAEDIMKISDCDLFIYVGGESDTWAEDALKEAANKDMRVINLLEVLGNSVKTEEMVEGMQEQDEEEHGDEDHNDEEHGDNEHGEDGHEHEEEKDEHVWLSLRNAEILCETIADELAAIDPENAEIYEQNEKTYAEKLNELEQKFQETVNAAKQQTLLFGDRFPFRYLVDDYGLSYYAAFVGCSAETEASFETIFFLAKKVDELKLPCVLTIEGAQHKIAETIVQNTAEKNQKVLTMDSMQSTTSKDVANGTTYLSVMEKNLTVLAEALG